YIITHFSLPNEPTPHQLCSLPAGSLLALRSYLKGLKAGLTLRLVVQILFKIKITALLTAYRLIFEATNQQALDVRAFELRILQSAIYELNSRVDKYHDILSLLFLEPFDKIYHAIMYAADSFDERGYHICNEYGNKVNMSV
ncbi:hypothetical protein BJX70DRAFT_384961, partial [Aspergillus crustosus]